MIRIRRRRPLEALKNDTRRRQISRGRWFYLIMLIAAAVWALDAFLGPTFYLKSEGLVAARPFTVATEYTATVQSIIVAEGERVVKGQVLMTASSQAMREQIADFALKLAESRARVAEVRAKVHVSDELAAAAKERSDVDGEAKRSVSDLFDRGLVASSRHAQAVRDAYRSYADERSLVAEAQSTRTQLEELTAPLDRAERAYNDLVETYAAGAIVAPVDGIVTAVHVAEGAVVDAGEPLLEIQAGSPRVFAYLPSGSLYSLTDGDPVMVWCGVREFPARVESVLPMAVALPAELQKRFKPVERAQIAVITFDDPQFAPPLFAKVAVRSRNWLTTSISQWVGNMIGSRCALPVTGLRFKNVEQAIRR